MRKKLYGVHPCVELGIKCPVSFKWGIEEIETCRRLPQSESIDAAEARPDVRLELDTPKLGGETGRHPLDMPDGRTPCDRTGGCAFLRRHFQGAKRLRDRQ